jgi:PKD domain-containing protein
MRLVLRLPMALVATLFCVSCDENTTSTKSANNPPTTISAANKTSTEAVAAKYTYSPPKGDVTTKFKFDASNSEGNIKSFAWDFGDGKTNTGEKVQHRFKKKGKYKVKLTISDGNNTDSETKILRVREDGGGGDGQGKKCEYTNPPRDVWFFKVINQDEATKTIVAEFQKPATCGDVFYLCGDVRIGGIHEGEKEYWIGIICEMWSLGNNKFRINLTNGKYWVKNGETGTYVWPQYDCDPHVYCKDYGY